MKKRTFIQHLVACGLFLLQLNLVMFPIAIRAADEPGVVDKTKVAVQDAEEKATAAAKDAKASVEEAGRSAAHSLENLWSRVDESRLKNRTRDEIVAWGIMGVLVGAVAGMFTSLKTSGLGKVGRLLLGLAGALLGGMVVHVAEINFDWGPVLIRYEELLFSLAGAVLLVVLGRFIRSKSKKQPGGK